ncbi:MAG: Crp/Fnr family transcriptional regulator [SAR324 cluster bacterium]|nr:Crp/Fnr family transcriptional regulator [SAR324 cluster bacterium]
MAKTHAFPGHAPNPLSCFTCQSRSRSEWCVLSDEDLDLLDQAKVTKTYRPGQIIIAQGDPCRGIYCIESGTVALRKTDAEGNSALVRLAHAGQTFGYRTYFGRGEFTSSAEALEPCTICLIETPSLRRLLDHNPALGFKFLEHLAHDLANAEETILQNVSLPVRTRLAHLLLTLKDRYGSVDDAGTLVISLPMRRQDIADLLGTRAETIARTIRTLEQDQVANFSGRRVMIPDLDNLLDEIDPVDH